MARKKRRSHKRRKVSGIGAALRPNGPIVAIAALAAGYFMADTINTPVDKVFPASVDTMASGWVKPGIKLAVGGFLLAKKKKSLLTTIPGGLLAGAGLKQALVKAGVVSGFQSVPVIAGYQAVPVIAGMPSQLSGHRVNGMPPALSGHRVNGMDNRVMGGMGSDLMC